MQSVTSNDGTEIAYELDGDGPPVVLVHGGSGTRRSWNPLRPHLADEFTLPVPDRRGRGGSGDAEGYSLDREVADLQAVVDDLDALPVWPHEVNLHLAGTVVRENRAVERYDLPDRLDLSVRTLLLRSEYGPEHLRDGVRALHDALAGSRLVDLEGVGHVGTASAPGRVADAVGPFLRGESDRPGEVGVTE